MKIKVPLGRVYVTFLFLHRNNNLFYFRPCKRFGILVLVLPLRKHKKRANRTYINKKYGGTGIRTTDLWLTSPKLKATTPTGPIPTKAATATRRSPTTIKR